MAIAIGKRGSATLDGAIRDRAEASPDRAALTFLSAGPGGERTLTYAALGERVDAIAAELVEAAPAGARALLHYEPGTEFVAAFLACLRAGVAAVPVYPGTAPADLARLTAIAAHAGATLVLSDRPEGLASLEGPQLLAPGPGGAGQVAVAREAPDGLAFVQYTSGSTSSPRGVLVTHASLLRNQELIGRAFGTGSSAVVVSWLPLYHDMGLIGSLLHPLYQGARCVLLSPFDFLRDPVSWLRAIERHGGTTSGGPNFGYELCCRASEGEELAGLDLSSWQVAFNGAEPVRAETLRRFSRRFAPHGFRQEAFQACYGLAEATLMVSAGGLGTAPTVGSYDLDGSVARPSRKPGAVELVSCGRPFASRLAVVGPDGREVNEREIGEIWIADDSIADGYLGNPRESTEVFAATIDGEGPFLRSGDLGFLDGSQLFITGRAKDMLVIRGRNVYPQDVERAAETSHPSLRRGCVVAFGIDVEDEERLVIVQELRRGAGADTEIVRLIRAAIAEQQRLRPHAVTLVAAGSIPRTSSNKVRRGACRELFLAGELAELIRDVDPEPGAMGAATGAAAAPVGEREGAVAEAVRAAVAAATGLVGLDAQTPLTAAGIDSIAAVELCHELEPRLGLRVEPTWLLDGGSAEDAARAALAVGETAAEPEDGAGEEAALSPGQKALWFFHRLAPANPAYTISRAFEIEGDLDLDRLEWSLRALVERHATLRTSYREGTARERCAGEAALQLAREDASGWDEGRLQERIAAEAGRPFDLESEGIVRAALLRRSATRHVLLLSLHHIAADFWSLEVALEELVHLYEQGEAGRVSLPAAPSYADQTRRLRRLLASKRGAEMAAHWERELTPAPPPLELPLDSPRPPLRSFAGAEHRFCLEAGLAAELGELASVRQVTLYTLLLSAYAVLLHRYSGSEDIAIGSPTAGRWDPLSRRAVGYFVNPVVIRVDLAGDPSFATLLGRVRERVLGALANQAYPFSTLVERLGPPRDPGRSPFFDAMFTLQRSRRGEDAITALALPGRAAPLAIGGTTWTPRAAEQRTSLVDVDLSMALVGGELRGAIRYSTDLFEAGSIAALAESFATLLAGIAAGPERRVATLPLASPGERRRQLRLAAPEGDYRQDIRLHQLFEQRARRQPGRTAVVADGEAVSFAELDDRAGRLASLIEEVRGE